MLSNTRNPTFAVHLCDKQGFVKDISNNLPKVDLSGSY